MRTMFLAGLALVALILSIGVMTGTAVAATGVMTRDDASCTANTAGSATGTFTCIPLSLLNGRPFPSGITAPLCTVTSAVSGATCSEDVPGIPEGGSGFPGGHLPGGGFPPNLGGHFGGHVIVLDGGPTLDACSASTFPQFVDRYQIYRGNIDQILGADAAQRWLALHQACTPITSTNTTVNGNCTTVTTDVSNYRQVATRWNDTVNEFRPLRTLTPAQEQTLRNLTDQRNLWLNRFNRDRVLVPQTSTNSTTVCQAANPTTINNITINAAPSSFVTPSPSTSSPSTSSPSDSSPTTSAPTYSAPSSGSSIPQRSVKTGGDDPGFALLWPWA